VILSIKTEELVIAVCKRVSSHRALEFKTLIYWLWWFSGYRLAQDYHNAMLKMFDSKM